MSDNSGVYDLILVGGGMVGATLACALQQSGLNIALLEAYPFASTQQPSYDDRSTALSFGSRRIYEKLGLWAELREGATAIDQIHISDRGHFGAARLDCAEEGVDALGYVIENRILGQVLAERLESQGGVELIMPAQVERVENGAEWVSVTLQQAGESRCLQAKLVVVADGSESALRQQLGVPTEQKRYGQTAIICNISTDRQHNNVAYERFTDSGPLALLPLSAGRCALVLSCLDEQVEALLALSDAEFIAHVQRRFGHRLGRFTRVGRRSSYPLQLLETESQQQGRVLLLGNAARTLHPVAGQGLNLALRDMDALLESLLAAAGSGADLGAPTLLAEFVEARRADQRQVVRITDGLVTLFSNGFAPVVALRGAGLLALDLLPALRHRLAKQMMGLGGRLPRW
ncbi:MAG: 2-octaprenyl-6-methoxyphenyl hydroxylase [Gammaproteobacteria bacterium]|nr:2-octaprenyl-6-methoxyphenyl hydroxylase [Gammaproteobacteria bacterium]